MHFELLSYLSRINEFYLFENAMRLILHQNI